MSNQVEDFNNQHTLQQFDGELNQLHALKLTMAQLVLNQLELAMLALDEGDIDIAKKVIDQDQKVDDLELQIDAEVLEILARQAPVAGDLRTVISTSKIASELEQMAGEIVDFAKLIIVLYDPKSSDPNPRLLIDIVKIGNLVTLMLNNLLYLLEHKDAHIAYSLIKYDRDCEKELQEGIKHQLTIVVQDARLISRAIDIMHILKALERCGEFCRNIAEHMIFMIEGKYVRHSDVI